MTEVQTLDDPTTNGNLVWSPGSRYVACGDFFTAGVRVYDVVTGQRVAVLDHGDSTEAIAWSPDGKRLATSHWDQTVKVWEVGSWRETLHLDRDPETQSQLLGGGLLSWTPDGKNLAAGSVMGWVVMWDARTGRELLSFKAHSEQVRTIAISPDGRRIATATLTAPSNYGI